jgi:hypothetical protein
MKTACVLSYWGKWREGRALRARFVIPGLWSVPWHVASQLACSPVGAAVGALDRWRKR